MAYNGAAEDYLLASSSLELEFPATSAPAQVEFSMPQYLSLAYYSSLVEAVASILRLVEYFLPLSDLFCLL